MAGGSLGQSAEVTVDSFPGQTFTATVVYISDKAEFTPRNVQTPADRIQQVFGVRLRLDAPELRPGMSIEALAQSDRLLIVGSFLRKDHPLLAARIRAAVRRGARVAMLHGAAEDLLMPVAAASTRRGLAVEPVRVTVRVRVPTASTLRSTDLV